MSTISECNSTEKCNNISANQVTHHLSLFVIDNISVNQGHGHATWLDITMEVSIALLF